MKTHPWNLAPGQFDGILRELRFRFQKWDTHACGALKIIPESVVLTSAEHSDIVETAERLAAVLVRAEARVRSDADLLSSLGIPAGVLPLIRSEPERPLHLARYDLFPTVEGGWAVSEFNEDVPGGFNEIIAAPVLLAGLHPGCWMPGDFARAFLDAVPADGPVALMYATGYSEDLQHMLVLETLLHSRSQATVLCAPSHLHLRRGRPMINGAAIRSVVRFYPGEWFPFLRNIGVWRRALPALPMLNPLSRLIRQSKRLFALWDDVLAPADAEFMKRVTPATRFFDPREIPELRSRRERYVLKRAFGRMGDAVAMGNLVTAAEWEQALAEAARKPDEFLVQERFEVAPLMFSQGSMYAALGVFLVNGRFAGYYSRASASPFLTHEASYVPTVVEVS